MERLPSLSPVLLFCGFMLAAIPAMAQTPVTNEMANAYYQSCMSKTDPRLTVESQQALCSCTSAKTMETMSVEDIQIMAENTPRGRAMLNYMLLNVYAPCMAYPVHDIAYSRCVADEKIDMMGLAVSKESLCGCVAERTGRWLSESGSQIMSELLQNDPNMTDPMTPVIEGKPFQQNAYENLVACLNRK